MELNARLAAIVGADNVHSSAEALAPHLVDWRGRYRGAARCLVLPASTAETAAVLRLCAETATPVVPQGGNTSHCGAGIPDASGSAVLLGLSRMKRIRAIDPLNNTITVEAGCVLQAVQEAAAAVGRLFPLSLAAEGSCQIGGNLATNAGGVQVLRYGNMRELTLGLEVVLPDGAIWDGLRGLRKDNSGYDLKQLFIGAEGTLGVITAAVLKLFPAPAATVTVWLSVASPQAAVVMCNELQRAFGAALTACELVSDVALGLVQRHLPAARLPLAPSPWQMLVELAGPGDEALLRQQTEDFLEKAFADGRIDDAALAQSGAQARDFWRLRESVSEAQKIEGWSIKHDISVPVSRIADFIAQADAALLDAFPGIRIVCFGHVGDGNLHYNQSKPQAQENAEFMAMQPRVNAIVHDIAHRLGGSISAEHGIGQLKRDELRRYKSAVEMDMMGAIKRTLDPQGIMNPGKLL